MTTIAELREQVRGPVVEPGDDGYEELRLVHNGRHDRRPALIVRAVATADAVATVNYARDTGLDLAVRGGATALPGSAPVTAGSSSTSDRSTMCSSTGPRRSTGPPNVTFRMYRPPAPIDNRSASNGFTSAITAPFMSI